MSGVSTHILDLSSGAPAAGVGVQLDVAQGDGFVLLSDLRTGDDGRVTDLLGGTVLRAATYRLTFMIGPYLVARGSPMFYPQAQVLFVVSDPARHHHIPLLLSAYGYSTYRGS